MRRLARQSFVKHVSAAVTGGAHSVAPGANYQHVLFSSEKQVRKRLKAGFGVPARVIIPTAVGGADVAF